MARCRQVRGIKMIDKCKTGSSNKNDKPGDKENCFRIQTVLSAMIPTKDALILFRYWQFGITSFKAGSCHSIGFACE